MLTRNSIALRCQRGLVERRPRSRPHGGWRRGDRAARPRRDDRRRAVSPSAHAQGGRDRDGMRLGSRATANWSRCGMHFGVHQRGAASPQPAGQRRLVWRPQPPRFGWGWAGLQRGASTTLLAYAGLNLDGSGPTATTTCSLAPDAFLYSGAAATATAAARRPCRRRSRTPRRSAGCSPVSPPSLSRHWLMPIARRRRGDRPIASGQYRGEDRQARREDRTDAKRDRRLLSQSPTRIARPAGGAAPPSATTSASTATAK